MKNITPARYKCALGTCPAVYELGSEIVVIGKKVTTPTVLSRIEDKIGADEYAIVIDRAMLAEVAPRSKA
jgi:hypothetical protein